MEKYNAVRKAFWESYQEYLKKLEIYNLEYEKGKNYVQEHKCSYKELTEKATNCSNARVRANSLWNICLSHPLHYHVKGYPEPEINKKYGVK